MDINTLIEKSKTLPEKDRILMILSNKIDMGSSEGGLISVRNFDALAEDLLKFIGASRNCGLLGGEVTKDDLYYLALFLKRCGHNDLIEKASNTKEAEEMKYAVGRFEKALAAEGINPR